jgi:Fe-S-cluster containining protein
MASRISNETMEQYERLIARLEQWSRSVASMYAGQMHCGRGCARCCYGLFDISVFDAMQIVEGFAALPQPAKGAVAEAAAILHSAVSKIQPGMEAPYFLDGMSPERIDEIVDLIGEARCPFLDPEDGCLIYEYRPVTCRLEGIPMVDARDGLFGDWCEMNFQKGITADMLPILELDYYEIQAVEQQTAVFIPSVVCALVTGQWSVVHSL